MYPFTASQWKELQLQVLIFEYIASGVPIPQELMFCCFDPYYAHPFTSLERVAEEDPEPRRCRRTDGKKWRCTKDALPDFKYCESHMHRGKKACSRKRVEIPSTTSKVQSLFGFSPQNGSLYSPADKICRYPEREENVDQCKERDRLWQFTPLEMSSLGMKKSSSSSRSHFTRDEYKEEGSRHCFVLGVDLMLQRPLDVNREDNGAGKPKPLHLFDE